jgi:hypothetical protein
MLRETMGSPLAFEGRRKELEIEAGVQIPKGRNLRRGGRGRRHRKGEADGGLAACVRGAENGTRD